jgi:hypothetical protein
VVLVILRTQAVSGVTLANAGKSGPALTVGVVAAPRSLEDCRAIVVRMIDSSSSEIEAARSAAEPAPPELGLPKIRI